MNFERPLWRESEPEKKGVIIEGTCHWVGSVVINLLRVRPEMRWFLQGQGRGKFLPDGEIVKNNHLWISTT